MEDRDCKIAGANLPSQLGLLKAVRVGKYGFFVEHPPHTGTGSAAKGLAPQQIEEIARSFGRSVEEIAWLLNTSPAAASQRQNPDMGTGSELGVPMRCGKYTLYLPRSVDNEIPRGANILESEQLGEIVGSFQAALGSIGGTIGGRSKSEAKVAAARKNGKLGGRPRGSMNKVKRRSETNTDES